MIDSGAKFKAFTASKIVMLRVSNNSRIIEIIKNNATRIGLNTLSNRFYYISKIVSLDLLNLTYVHFKKIMKIQFLKNGKT